LIIFVPRYYSQILFLTEIVNINEGIPKTTRDAQIEAASANPSGAVSLPFHRRTR